MNTNQESHGVNFWWYSDSPVDNWLQKVRFWHSTKLILTFNKTDFDFQQNCPHIFKSGVHVWVINATHGVKVKCSLFSMTCLPKFLWEPEVFTDMWPSQNNLCGQWCGKLKHAESKHWIKVLCSFEFTTAQCVCILCVLLWKLWYIIYNMSAM